MSDLAALGFELARVDDRLVLKDLQDEKIHPLEVDFLNPTLKHRLRSGLSKTQPLPKALGLKGGGGTTVLDATAGLGTDSFIIAAYGCRVRAIERSPIVFALLEDGFERLKRSGEHSEIAARLSFEHGNAIEIMSVLTAKEEERPQVIYLDPMYPEEGKSKSALPKKGMQMFRRLIGNDVDTDALFAAARAYAKERVVVKRPLHAPPLGSKPTHVFEGKTARYDMYLCR